MASPTAATPETLVTLKINVDGSNRRFKLPLRELGPGTLPDKLRFLLAIPPTSEAVFERYSDSAAAFIILDPHNTSVYKQLYRAAKAKLKLRLKVTIIDKESEEPAQEQDKEEPRVMPKPASVEDEEQCQPTPVEQANYHYSVSPTPPVAQSASSTSFEAPTLPGSVAQLQRGFEELLISHPRYSCNSASMKSNSGCPYKATTEAQRSCYFPPNDIPVSRGSAAREKWFAELANVSQERQDAIRNTSSILPSPVASIFSVYCNNCENAIPDEHYHCSTCDDGDFDLCQNCVSDGVTCNGEGHWMIKRFVKNGKVITSTTETIAPKAVKTTLFSESKTTLVPAEEEIAARTCNSCIQELPEENFVTCTTCEDFDLCIACHIGLEHGHNPKHAFERAVEDTNLDVIATALLAPGRNTSHNAICDGCDQYVYGVRHKCLDCPDWDYCSACIVNSSFIHPGHRFVPVYEPLYDLAAVNRAYATKSRHHGIYCDGPLCKGSSPGQSYIKGDRYKCAVCHDTDFCANCEASPSNQHNKTHPLIKFKTPVRNASITTVGEHGDGRAMPLMGDRRGHTTSKATETTPAASANAATQVQTVADLQPSAPNVNSVEEKVEAKVEEPEIKTEEVVEAVEVPEVKEELVAHFVRDAVSDGTVFPANTVFEQTWYLRNGGKTAWPAGCSVKFVGGDNMCAVDPDHPASVHELVSAAESTTCYTEVASGQESGFTVLMRTPNRSGNFISYWRLTGPDGNKFGHRLWCDVNVEVSTPIKEETKEEATLEESQMIFPKLEKESPTTSIHEETLATKPQSDDEDDFEDFVEEPLEESDDGFLTDSDDYEILEADEYLAGSEKK